MTAWRARKTTFADRGSELALFVLRPFVEAWMRVVARRVVEVGPGMDFRRREPFLLVANHSFAMDVVHVPMPFRVTPHIVASRDMFVDPLERFVITRIARCVMAPKGGGDVRTVRELLDAIARGYPVLVFPEGDITFSGATGEVPGSIAVFAKKAGVDVIACRVAGGHLSAPRWARAPRRNRTIELRYELVMGAKTLAASSPRQVAAAIAAALRHDEFARQRELMLARPGKRLAEGLEDLLYACPQCGAFHSMETAGNALRCAACGREGRLDEYGFLHGFRYDTTLDWDGWQRGLDAALAATSFSSPGMLFTHDYATLRRRRVGPVEAVYRDGNLVLAGALDRAFPCAELRDVCLTMRSTLHFSEGGVDYVLDLERKAPAFLRACLAAAAAAQAVPSARTVPSAQAAQVAPDSAAGGDRTGR